MTQDVLNDMESDEVNSINDTIEAQQVAQIIKTTYYEMLGQREWDHLRKTFTLGSGTAAKPTHMTVADDVTSVKWIKYNKRETAITKVNMVTIPYASPEEFLLDTNGRDSLDSTVDTVVDETGVNILIKNDAHPTFYTSFNDELVVFDSYDSGIETNLQQSMTQCYGVIEPSFSLTDTFVPDFPVNVFSGFLAEAKSVCFNALKQVANSKEEQRSRRQRYSISRDKRRNAGSGIQYPDYGRK